MKTLLTLATLAVASTQISFAGEGIYGYAIRCTNGTDVRVSVRQHDDDIAFQSVGLGAKAKFVFVESDQAYNAAARKLVFTPAEGRLPLKMTVAKTEPGSPEGSQATALVELGNRKTELACEVRYGKDEEDFDDRGLAAWADGVLSGPTVWGGKHLELTVEGESASLQFDCAYATVKSGWVAKDGVVSAKGTYLPGSGIAFPPGHQPKPVPASFRAVINGSRMSLTVSAQGMELSTYQLVKGKQGEVYRCM